MKIKRYLGRFFLWLLLVILLLPALLFIIIQIKPVQLYLNSKISIFLEKKLNTPISIGYIYYEPPYKIVFNNILVKDFQQDTLFYISKLKLVPIEFNIKKNKFVIDKIELKNVRFKYIADSNGYANLDYFTDHIPQSPSTPQDKKHPFNFTINKIEIHNGSFLFDTKADLTGGMGLDFRHMDFPRVNLQMAKFTVYGDSVSFDLQNLWAYEKKGLRVRHLSMFFYYNGLVCFDKVIIALNKSQIIADKVHLAQPENGWIDYRNMGIEMNISPYTTFDISDLSYFSDSLKNYFFRLKLGINSTGTIANFQINDFYLKYANNTEINLNGSIIGLPAYDSAYYDVNITKFFISKNDLLKLSNPLTRKQIIKLPKKINLPNFMIFRGSFQGFMNEFDFNGALSSPVGDVNTSITYLKDNTKQNINGTIDVNNLDIGYLIQNNKIGKLTIHDSLNINYSNTKKIDGYNIAKINDIFLNNYDFKNISLATIFKNDSIIALFAINDENIKAKLTVNSIIKKELKSANFSLILDTMRFYPLHLSDNDKLAAVSLGLDGSFDFKDINTIRGNINLSRPIYIIKNLQVLTIRQFSVSSDYQIGKDTMHYYSAKTDLFDFNANGNMNFNEIKQVFSTIASYYIPATTKSPNKNTGKSENQKHFKFDLDIYDISYAKEVLFPNIFLANNSKISGNFYANNNFTISFYADSLLLSKNKFYDISLKINADSNALKSQITLDSLKISSLKFKNLKINTSTAQNFTKFSLVWDNKTQPQNYGNINSFLTIAKNNSGKNYFIVQIPTDTVVIDNIMWTVGANKIVYDTTGIELDNFIAKNRLFKQSINLNGKLSHSDKDSLYLKMSNISLSQLNPLIKKVTLSGNLNIDAKISQALDTPQVWLNDSITDITINDAKVGNLYQSITYNGQNKSLQAITTLYKFAAKQLDSNTLLLYSKALYSIPTKQYEVSLNIKKLPFKPFEPFYANYIKFSSLSNLNGDIFISGKQKDMKVLGEANIYGAFLILQTGITYSINGGMHINATENKITINKTVLVGPNLVGDATLSGTITHQNFSNPYVDINLKVDTMPVFKTLRTQKSKYYGNIFISGNFNVKGYPQNLFLLADVSTEANTNFIVLLDRPTNISNKMNIVNFASLTKDTSIKAEDTVMIKDVTEREQKKANAMSLDFDVNLSLNPQSKFKIFINESNNEYLEIQSGGNIKIKQNQFGDLILYGKAEIEKGVYNFVLQNIINRKFVIQKGSSITFNGGVMEAMLDIATVYSIKNVSLYNLLIDNQYLNNKTQADCYIRLTGPITNPQIKFDVKLPTTDPKINNQLQALDENEMNKQFLSLMVLGRFQPLPGLSYDPTVEQTLSNTFNPGELVSNQLNSLLSNFNTNIDLNVNYISGNTANNNNNELNVGVTVPLLNNRINISTDVGYASNTYVPTSQNQLIGEFEATFKLNKDGNLQLKAFNKNNPYDYYEQGYTQGLGLIYNSTLDNLFKKNQDKKQSIDSLRKKQASDILKNNKQR